MTNNITYNISNKLRLAFKIFLIISLLVVTASPGKAASYKAQVINYSKLKDVNKISLEEKIGQMLMVGFTGYTINKEVINYIKKYHIGGVILFDKGVNKERTPNIKDKKQLKTLTFNLQKESKIPLFIAVDNEGGKVTRLKEEYGFLPTPSHEELAKKGSEATYKYSKRMADELKEVGINVNFAPVVDLNINPKNPVIGALGRAFAKDSKTVTKMAEAYIKGQNSANVITSIKHFPGHGSSAGDSHLGMVDVTKTWQKEELVPYSNLITKYNYNEMVMVAHVINRKLDKKTPASLSKAVMTDLLRNKLGFKGVIVTDSLDMNAIYDHYSYKEVLIKAINGGADIILNANNNKRPFDHKLVENSVKIIKEAVKNGEISEQKINDAYLRIIKLKQQFNL